MKLEYEKKFFKMKKGIFKNDDNSLDEFMEYEEVIEKFLILSDTNSQYNNYMKNLNKLKENEKTETLEKLKKIDNEFLETIDKNKYFLISKYNEVIKKESQQKIKILDIVKNILIKRITDKFPKFWFQIEELDKEGKIHDANYKSELKDFYLKLLK